MKKKISVLATTVALVASVTLATPSFAANKPGGSCTKANATTKIGGDSYVCTKNPTVKNAKLTWVWAQCISANKDYITAQNALADSLAKANDELAKIDADIAKYQATVAVNEAKAVAAETKAKDLQAKAAAKGITIVDKAFKADIKRVMTTATGEAKATITATEVIALAAQWKTTVDKVAPMIQWLSADDLLIQADQFRAPAKTVDNLKAQRARTVNFQTTMKNSATTSLQSTKSTRDQACKPGL